MTTTRTYTITRKGEDITFDSTLTNDEAAKVCAGMLFNTFATDIARRYTAMERMSGPQLGWMHYLADEQIRRDAEPEPEPQFFPGIYELLHRMSKRSKSKQVSRVAVYWRTLRLSIAGDRANVPGSITVTSAEKAYDARSWHGRIDSTGEMQGRRYVAVAEEVVAALRELSADPTEETLAREGRVSGVCCRCNAELTTEVSKTLGFGSTCAKYLGLKHGKRAATAAREADENSRLELVNKEAV